MQIIRDTEVKIEYDTAIALGCFDGVHLGHAKVIGSCVDAARVLGCKSAVWTFSSPIKSSPICPLDEKLALIEALGVDIVVVADFTKRIASVPARDFLSHYILQNCRAVHISCGFNYSFGAMGKGNTDLLAAFCSENDISLEIIPPVKLSGKIISSSAIRELIMNNNLSEAKEMLGHDISGGGF